MTPVHLPRCRRLFGIVTLVLTLQMLPRASSGFARPAPSSYWSLHATPLEVTPQSVDDAPPEIIHLGSQRYWVLTKSRDKRYVIAWGGRQSWAKNHRKMTAGAYFGSVTANDDTNGGVVDCMIDCEQHRVVATIDGCHHSADESHSSLDVLWGDSGRYAIIIWGGKWGTRGMYRVTLSGPNAGRQASFMNVVGRTFDRFETVTAGHSIGDRLGESDLDARLDTRQNLVVDIRESPGKRGFGAYCVGTVVYALDADGIFTAPLRSVGNIIVSDSGQRDPDDPDSKVLPPSLYIARFRADGKLDWRVDVPVMVRKNLQRIIAAKTPKTGRPTHVYVYPGNPTKELQDLDQPRPPLDTDELQFDVDVAIRQDGRDAPLYTATFTYRLAMDNHVTHFRASPAVETKAKSALH